MSTEKNPEVVGCDASIMKNVWEIREREYAQKIQMEGERIERSALLSINKVWADRLAARHGNYKRVERKAKPAEPQPDNDNLWKSKKPLVPPTPPRGGGSGPLGRPAGQSKSFSSQAPNNKDKKGKDKTFNKLQLLMSITQTQPSTMVWGKSWKYNKSLPPPAEGITDGSNWGQCWMFATQQPYTEAGKPWPNGPNMMDVHSLHLWKKSDYRMMESQELDLCLPTEEWQMSWRKHDKNKEDTSSINGEMPGLFTLLLETQNQNKALSSSEWCESWKSTKPASQQEDFTVPNDSVMNESVSNKQDKNSEMNSMWEECWKLVNHHGSNKSQLPQVKKCHSPEWVNSWRAAMVVNNLTDSDHSDGCIQQEESHPHEILLVSREQKYRDLCLQLCNDLLSEWSKSWQVNKNNSKPSEEIEKVLKALPPKTEIALGAQKVEESPKGCNSTSEKADSYYEQLKHNVIYQSKRELTKSKLLLLNHADTFVSSSEWRESWKTLKHRMRMERRRMRPDPKRPFRESEKGKDMKPTAAEWKDSWKFNCHPLRQEPDLWQQGWSTTPQIRIDRAREQNHFVPVQRAKNGPTAEQNWGESWRFSRRQHRSEHGQGNAQTSQVRSNVTCHHTDNSQGQRRNVRSVSDWQAAWMVSENQFHHDKPSLIQWREAWKWSVFHTEHWAEHVSRENWVDEIMEIQPLKEKISLQRAKANLSRSFDNQIFKERYPETQWSTSWKAESLLNHQPKDYGSSGIPGKSNTPSEHGSKWGRSFRLANPMPHMEKPWVESSPNQCHYTVMWSRGKNTRNKIHPNLSNNPASFRLWGNCHRFLQGGNVQVRDKNSSKPVDPRVIITKKTKTRRHLYSTIEKQKPSDRKWPGCHLLGKTQPRPKKGPASVKKLKMEDETKDVFFEEWAESWRFLVRPGSLKKQMKSLSGWTESWKFLLPPYPPMNHPKAK